MLSIDCSKAFAAGQMQEVDSEVSSLMHRRSRLGFSCGLVVSLLHKASLDSFSSSRSHHASAGRYWRRTSMPMATYFGVVGSMYRQRLHIQDGADSVAGCLYHFGGSVGSVALAVDCLLISTSTRSVSTPINLIYYSPHCGQFFYLGIGYCCFGSVLKH